MLLLIAITLSAWSILSRPTQAHLPQHNPKEADSYMQDVVAILMSKEGLRTLQLITPIMIHYPENNATTISTPRVTVFKHSSQPWTIDADYAKTTHGLEQVLFWSHVNIHHVADEENPTTTVHTESLLTFPDQQIAKTNVPITFIQADTIVHAVGMLADLNAGTIKLLSNAKGVYVPAS